MALPVLPLARMVTLRMGTLPSKFYAPYSVVIRSETQFAARKRAGKPPGRPGHRLWTLLLLSALALAMPAWAQSDEDDVLRAVQRAFDAMAAHDGVALYEIFLPEAAIVGVMPDGQRRGLRGDEFIQRSVSSQEKILERIWDAMVSVNSGVATLVAPYDFHRDGKFSHCGVDAVTLLKTSTGWRISHIFFTMVREGCPASPLGKPKP